MSTIDDGGPAFPSPGIKDRFGNTWAPQRGMTLRDYFIAHAPLEPQDWFKPVLPPDPRPDVGDPPEDFKPGDPARIAYMDLCAKFREAEFRWEAEKKKQRLVQWPAAWADEMIKARKPKP